MSKFQLLTLLFIFPLFLNAQKALNRPQKREFRAVWIATVANIDYPKQPSQSKIAIEEQYKNLLDKYEKLGFNAVIFQVRSAADAFYPTEMAPWSAYLTGRQGRAPKPASFDPLEFMIKETHARGMEFHAWFNPLRATMNLDKSALAVNHIYYKHPEWIIEYGRKYYLNPALPEVHQYVADVVGEVVEKYDIDAVHFDDYFYPYPKKGHQYPDSSDYKFYGSGYTKIEDWRRDNVNKMVENVSERIKETKAYVKFGISPFGVWRNKKDDPFGSDTRAGVTSYDDLYADVVHWMRLGWIDYVAPQIYWNIGFEPADYATLADWWAIQTGECNLYIGHAAYKVGDNKEEAWHESDEMAKQIFFNRSNTKILGSIYFSSRSILKNRLALKDTLASFYSTPALLPETKRLGLNPKAAPRLRRLRRKNGDVRLKWKPAKQDKEKPPFYYVIYRFDGVVDQDFDFKDPKNILKILPLGTTGKRFKYIDETAEAGKLYTYVITAVNRQHTESKHSKKRRILKRERGFKRLR